MTRVRRGGRGSQLIQTVDQALETCLRRLVPLAEPAVGVSFDAPDRTWGAGLTRPTVNAFLWQITRNPGVLRTGLEQRTGPDGRVERRPTTPIVDLHYLVTAWATEVGDEHRLLGSVLQCVLAHSCIPDEDLPASLAGRRCSLGLAPPDRHVPGEFWSALDGRLKPGLQLVVALPLDVFVWSPTAAPAEAISVDMDRRTPQPVDSAKDAFSGRRRRANGAMVMEARAGPDTGPEPDI